MRDPSKKSLFWAQEKKQAAKKHQCVKVQKKGRVDEDHNMKRDDEKILHAQSSKRRKCGPFDPQCGKNHIEKGNWCLEERTQRCYMKHAGYQEHLDHAASGQVWDALDLQPAILGPLHVCFCKIKGGFIINSEIWSLNFWAHHNLIQTLGHCDERHWRKGAPGRTIFLSNLYTGLQLLQLDGWVRLAEFLSRIEEKSSPSGSEVMGLASPTNGDGEYKMGHASFLCWRIWSKKWTNVGASFGAEGAGMPVVLQTEFAVASSDSGTWNWRLRMGSYVWGYACVGNRQHMSFD